MAILSAREAETAGKSRRAAWAAGILILGGAGLALWLWGREFDGNQAFLSLMLWLDRQGLQAALWIIAFQAVLVVTTIPGPIFTMASGFLFGMWGGSVVAVCGTTLGSIAAYWIARTFPEGNLAVRLARFPRLRALERFVLGGGWKVVLATRLIPFFPFKLSNYFFGWVRFPFPSFFWGTALGIVPVTLFSVSLGALASDLTALAHPELAGQGNRWIWSLAGLAGAGALLAWAGLRARAAWRAAVPEERDA